MTASELAELYPGRWALALIALKGRGKAPRARDWTGLAAERWLKGTERDSHLNKAAEWLANGDNLGLALPAGVVALDADTPEATAWLDTVLPDAPMQETARGAHFVVRVPSHLAIRATAGVEVAAGVTIDLRVGGKSQIVTEPSVHQSGHIYTWKRELPASVDQLPECPAAILERICAPQKPSQTRSAARDGQIQAGERNDALARVAGKLRRNGLSAEAIDGALQAVNRERCQPPLGKAEVAAIAQSIGRYPAGDGAKSEELERSASAPPPGSQRREICLSDRQLDAIVDDALEVLRETNEPAKLFERSGLPSRVRRDENGAPTIVHLSEHGLVDALSCAADWVHHHKNGTRHNAHPTRQLAGVVLAALVRKGGILPPLRGLIEAPLMREDGTILDCAGYDRRDALYYAPEPGFQLPVVPQHPTVPELQAAVALIRDELLGEFPFASDSDRATAFAALLTIVLRPMIAGNVPAFLIDAPAPGTGKSLLAKAVSVVATGRPATMMSPAGGRDDAEWRKRITSTLLLGGSVAVVDNLEEPVGSAALSSALTATNWTDRILGRSELVSLPMRTMWILTGNNIRLQGDLPRRVVWCRLDAKLARPWTRRDFRYPDLLEWAQRERGRLLAAIFTMARAWLDAGRPDPDASVARLGGFEQWRHVVGGVLMVAGVPDFLENLEKLYDTIDDETPAWAGFLKTWVAIQPEPVTAAELMALIDENEMLRESLPPDLSEAWDRCKAGRGSFTKRIGKALGRKVDVPFRVDEEREVTVKRRGEARSGVRWQAVAGAAG